MEDARLKNQMMQPSTGGTRLAELNTPRAVNSSSGIRQCPTCGFRAKSEFGLRIHIGMVHKDIASKVFPNMPIIKTLNNFMQTTAVTSYVPSGVVYDDWCGYLPILEKAYEKKLFTLIVGPKGVGKTTLVRKFAEKLQKPLYSINFSLRTKESHLVGQTLLENGSTKFALGIIPKSMQEGALLYLDELNCFPEGTRILTPSGYKPIEELSCGDEVVSFDPHIGLAKGVIQNLLIQRSRIFMTVKFSDGRQLTCTPEHPFFTRRGWVRARELQQGDEVLSLWYSDNVEGCKEVLQPQVLLPVAESTSTTEPDVETGSKGETLTSHERSLQESTFKAWTKGFAEADCKTRIPESRRKTPESTFDSKQNEQVLEDGRRSKVRISESKEELVESNDKGENNHFNKTKGIRDCTEEVERYVQEERNEQSRGLRQRHSTASESTAEIRRGWTVVVESSIRQGQVSRLHTYDGEESSFDRCSYQEEARHGAGRRGLQGYGLRSVQSKDIRTPRPCVATTPFGDLLWVRVTGIETKVTESTTVYNLHVEPYNTYIAEGRIVHNCAEPDVLIRLDEALDDRRELVLKEAGEAVTVKAKPDWYVIATINPLSHAGTKELPPQLLSRFPVRLYLDYPPMDVEKRIVKLYVNNSCDDKQLELALKLAEKLRAAAKVEDLYYGPSIRETIAFAKLVEAGVKPRQAAELVFANVYWQWGDTEVRKVRDLIASLWGEED